MLDKKGTKYIGKDGSNLSQKLDLLKKLIKNS